MLAPFSLPLPYYVHVAQASNVGPSGLPAGTLSIYGGCAGGGGGEQPGTSSPGQLAEGALPPSDAAAAAVGRGFHLGDMAPCDPMDTSSKTALWSGKVRQYPSVCAGSQWLCTDQCPALRGVDCIQADNTAT